MGLQAARSEAQAPLPSLPRVRSGMLAGISIYIAAVIIDLVRFPGILTDAGDAWPLYVALIAATAGLYIAFACHDTRRMPPVTALVVPMGVRWGLAVGVLWMIEVFAGNATITPLLLPFYFGAALAAYLLPAILGGLVAHRTGSVAAAVRTCVWCGLVSGLITACWLLLLTYLLLALGVSQHDAQNIQEFHRSHAPDLTSFIIGDTLLGATNHLWLIGPGLGALVGVVGATIGRRTPGSARSTRG